MSKTATKIGFGLIFSLTSSLVLADSHHSHQSHLKGDNKDLTSLSPKSSMEEAIKRFERNGLIPQLDYTDNMSGLDVNLNGVRDDIENILQNANIGEDQKKALLQYAKYNGTKVHLGHMSDDEIRKFTQNLYRTEQCLISKLPSTSIESYKTKLSLYHANTDNRAKSFEVAEKKLAESQKQLTEYSILKNESGCDWEDEVRKKKKRSLRK